MNKDIAWKLWPLNPKHLQSLRSGLTACGCLFLIKQVFFQEAAINTFCLVLFCFLKEIGEFPGSKKYVNIPNHAENSWKGCLLDQPIVLFLEVFRKMHFYS